MAIQAQIIVKNGKAELRWKTTTGTIRTLAYLTQEQVSRILRVLGNVVFVRGL